MKSFKRIMAAIDLSEFSTEVMKYAGHLVEDLKAELIIVNVINQRDVDTIRKISGYLGNFSIGDYIENQKRNDRIFRKVP